MWLLSSWSPASFFSEDDVTVIYVRPTPSASATRLM
jgi:hypothetical protein